MPYASTKQRAFLHIHHPEIAKRWDAELKKKTKKKIIGVDNKMKGSYGETTLQKGKPTIIKINVKKHNGNKVELADTIKHELMHAKHPKMSEKAVRKAVPKVISPAEQDRLIAKLQMKKLNYKVGVLKREMRVTHRKSAPGDLYNRAQEISREKLAIMSLM